MTYHASRFSFHNRYMDCLCPSRSYLLPRPFHPTGVLPQLESFDCLPGPGARYLHAWRSRLGNSKGFGNHDSVWIIRSTSNRESAGFSHVSFRGRWRVEKFKIAVFACSAVFGEHDCCRYIGSMGAYRLCLISLKVEHQPPAGGLYGRRVGRLNTHLHRYLYIIITVVQCCYLPLLGNVLQLPLLMYLFM
ncbi:hypothetical protein B0T13DRAFT_4621 [Neurospora crassa]|nr:hypothetical protein B0T13DRAFT_4621 [Neurospora crassa]